MLEIVLFENYCNPCWVFDDEGMGGHVFRTIGTLNFKAWHRAQKCMGHKGSPCPIKYSKNNKHSNFIIHKL
jgi:hypothetical protein